MTTITWDQPGERFYESGVDRGVLYLPSGLGVPWNGLVSVNEKPLTNDTQPVYFDGIKFEDLVVPGDYAGTISAYTYPDEFLEFEGVLSIGNGLFAANQQPGKFGLSYRTMIGNDEGDNSHYKIHLLYNLTAIPSQKSFQSFSNDPNVTMFEWSITGIPGEVSGFRPTAHIVFDTRFMGPLLLEDIENTLYGDDLNAANLPTISTLTSFISAWVIIRIIDNGDGTWTATGPNNLITILNATTFQIIQANAEYLDANTYVISDLTY